MSNLYDKCKVCGKSWGQHLQNNRCPLVDYKDNIVGGYYAKTFFEAEESEVDKLIRGIENGLSIIYRNTLNVDKLLQELKELRGDDER